MARSRRRWTRPIGALGATLFLLGAPGVSLGQDGTPPGADTPADAGVSPTPSAPVDAAKVASDMILGRALIELVRTEDQGLNGDDFALVGGLLEVALSLTPRDPELIRLLVEAHSRAGDRRGRVDELTRELIRLDPKDTVAQLRLIGDNLARIQTADERLAAYGRLLGPRGASLDPSVRSRLALDAALLERERGDTEAFASRLSEAIQFDPTNKTAATLAVAFSTDRIDDPAARLEMLLHLLYADPLDADTQFAIARQLAASGEADGAARYYRNGSRLLRSGGAGVGASLLAEMLVAEWMSDGAAGVIERVAGDLAGARNDAKSQRDAGLEQGYDPADLPDPDTITASVPVARVRLAAASGLRDDEAVASALEEVSRSFQADLEALRGILDDPEASEDARAEAEMAIFGNAVELTGLRLWAGLETEQASEAVASFRDSGQLPPEVMTRLEGLLAMRTGRTDEARALLESVADVDPLARVGLALLFEIEGEQAKAVSRYAELSREQCGTLAGAWAATSVLTLTGQAPAAPDGLARIRAIAVSVPSWMDKFVQQPRDFLTVEFEVKPSALGFIENPAMTLRVRNRAPIPLAFGPDRVIDGRFLVTANARAGTENVFTTLGMRVVNLDSRLRLRPNEAVTYSSSASAGGIARNLLRIADQALRVRWRLLQGFRAAGESGYMPGPGGATADSNEVFRQRLGAMAWPIERLESSIREGSLREALEASQAVQLRVTLAADDARRLADRDLRPVALALASRISRSPREERLALLMGSPFRGRDTAWLSPVFDAGLADADPGVRAITLAISAGSAQNPIFRALRDDPDPIVASVVRGRLSQWERAETAPVVAPAGTP